MNRNRIASLIAGAALSVAAAMPALAFEYAETCNGNGIRFSSANITFQASAAGFPIGPRRDSAEAARIGWNNYAPGSNWRISYVWGSPQMVLGNGVNELYVGQLDPGYTALTKTKRSLCSFVPTGGSHYTEADLIVDSGDISQLDTSTNPTPSDYMENLTLVLLHEHGHVLGLGHEDDVLATMNSGFPGPVGGPIGTRNDVHPLGDDVRGARNAYGTSGTVPDLAASAVRMPTPGFSRTIPAPVSSFRNTNVSFQFTVLNRGTTDHTFNVYFYLSPTRAVDPATRFYLGSTSVYLQYARSLTGTANVTIPSHAPTGYQYLSWVVDPTNAIGESDEGNNAVAMVSGTVIDSNRVPSACFNVTPTSGNAPVTVSANASCTSDPDGTSGMTYAWDFGDGSPIQYGQSVSYTYYIGGYYTITLMVTDPSGATSYTYRNVSVACPPGSPWCEEPL